MEYYLLLIEADGEASWVEIKTSLKSYKVNYEYGNIPEPLNKLIEEIKN